MLKRTFDLKKPYRVILYLRMSSDQQNKRSPEQQQAEIMRQIQVMRLPWIVAKVYRDDGKSGRLLRKRAGYQQMLRELRTGSVRADLIAVDTTERFGRVEELQAIRRNLWERDGVLIVTSDSQFCDPTTPQGRTFAAFEALRATEEGRVKAHQVLRGKRDLAKRGFWPGGPRPFGLKLVQVMNEKNGVQICEGSVLQPHPEEAWIIRLAFAEALAQGLGQVRLTKFLNRHPDIPAKFKNFEPATVGRWLKSTIYCGTLTWAANATDIIGDARVIEPNSPEDVLRELDFCEALVPFETWAAVNKLRQQRAAAIKAARQPSDQDGSKLLKAPAPGLTLKYLLTGLLRCGHCKRSLVPSSTSYTTVGGVDTKYASYSCPGYIGGNCDNGKRVPEAWARETVVAQIVNRLFPSA